MTPTLPADLRDDLVASNQGLMALWFEQAQRVAHEEPRAQKLASSMGDLACQRDYWAFTCLLTQAIASCSQQIVADDAAGRDQMEELLTRHPSLSWVVEMHLEGFSLDEVNPSLQGKALEEATARLAQWMPTGKMK
jgi:hypothetical protein